MLSLGIVFAGLVQMVEIVKKNKNINEKQKNTIESTLR